MTEITTLHTFTGKPVILRAIQFDPWPFEDEEVTLDSTWLLNTDGELEDTAFNVALYGPDSDGATNDNVLVVFSDGRVAVSSAQGVLAYGRPSPP